MTKTLNKYYANIMQNLLLIGAGGFLGSILRYYSNLIITKILDTNHPFGTLAVNIVGSFVIGLVIGLYRNGILSSGNWKLFLTIGFCGGFTTFSSFALENLFLLESQQFFISLFYISITLILGLSAVYFGFFITNNL